MADQRVQAYEKHVGANHPDMSDTLNRLALIEHENDGTHKVALGITHSNRTALDLVSGTNTGDQSIYVGSFQIDTATASGVQVITGVGFQPRAVSFNAGVNGTSEFSTGFDDLTNRRVSFQANTAGVFWGNSTASILLNQVDGAITYSGYISAVSADGFTITWTKVGAKTGTATINFMAFK